MNIIDPKSYPQILDEFSLHLFIIRKYVTIEDTPEFQSYKRTYYFEWDNILNIIYQLEKFCERCQFKLITIDGKKAYKLAIEKETPNDIELAECIYNKEIFDETDIPLLKYLGPNREEKAAIFI